MSFIISIIELDCDLRERIISTQRDVLNLWNRLQHVLSIWTREKSAFPCAVLRPFEIYGVSEPGVLSDDGKRDVFPEVHESDLTIRGITDKFYGNSSTSLDGSPGLRMLKLEVQSRWKTMRPAICLLVICESVDQVENMFKEMALPSCLLKRSIGTVLTEVQNVQAIKVGGIDVPVKFIGDLEYKKYVASVLFGSIIRFLDNLIQEAWSLFQEFERAIMENEGNIEIERSYPMVKMDLYDLFLDASKQQEILNQQIHEEYRFRCFQPHRITFIPSVVKREILSLFSVRGISLQQEKLKITLAANTRQKDVEHIENKIREILRKHELYIELTLVVQSVGNAPKPFGRIEQGSKVMNNVLDDPIKSGTLGIVLKINDDKHIALTAAHVLVESFDVFLVSNSQRLRIGICEWSTFNRDTLEFEKVFQSISDFAVVSLDRSVLCDVCLEFKTNTGHVLPKYLPNEDYTKKALGQTLYKRGAITGCTEGVISEVEDYKVHKIGSADDLEICTFFVVRGKDGQLFSKSGDSGAVTFTVDNEKKIIRIVAIVQGGENSSTTCSNILDCVERYKRVTKETTIGLTVEHE